MLKMPTDEEPSLLLQGDCREMMPTLPADVFDSVVCDPPYALNFMGKAWDTSGVAFDPRTWEMAGDTLKPGGYLLAFGGTRTYHRLACAIEDAGFEIRDCIMWLYGSGFPKGKGCLKPAYEPILLARKPGKRVLPLGIDACRVPASKGDVEAARVPQPVFNSPTGTIYGMKCGEGRNGSTFDMSTDRWPANVCHDGGDEVMEAFPEAPGQGGAVTGSEPSSKTRNVFRLYNERSAAEVRGDVGSAARFFYTAKADRNDRDEGLDGLPEVEASRYGEQGQGPLPQQTPRKPVAQRNHHPTVKPIALMRWLCKLVTPPGGIILDPFMGSGSTGKAAVADNFRFVGIEREPEYLEIARRRIAVPLDPGPLFAPTAQASLFPDREDAP